MSRAAPRFPGGALHGDKHREGDIEYEYNGPDNQWLLSQGPCIVRATAPIKPRNGELWHDTTTAHTFVWRNDISAWVMIS